MGILKFKRLQEWKCFYNPNVPSYSAEYQLSNEDDNVKQPERGMIFRLREP